MAGEPSDHCRRADLSRRVRFVGLAGGKATDDPDAVFNNDYSNAAKFFDQYRKR